MASALVFFNAYGLEFERPSWPNSSAAEYSACETFSVGFGEPGNTPDVEGSNGGGIITQATLRGGGDMQWERLQSGWFQYFHPIK